MRNVVLIILILLLGIGAYVYYMEPQYLDSLRGKDRQTATPTSPASETPRTDSPASNPNRKIKETGKVIIGSDPGDWYLNGEPVEPGSEHQLPLGTATLARVNDQQSALITFEVSQNVEYTPNPQLRDMKGSPVWSTFQGDLERRGRAALSDKTKLSPAWILDLETEIEAAPVARDGRIFFSGDSVLLGAVDAEQGKVLWKKGDMGSKVSPAVNETHAFVGDDLGLFHGLTNDKGKEKGDLALNTYPVSLTLAGDEMFLAVTRDSEIIAIATKKGFLGRLPLKTVWQTPVPNVQHSDAVPVVSGDHAVFNTAKNGLICLSLKDGSVLWGDPGQQTEDAMAALGQADFVDESHFKVPSPSCDGQTVYAFQQGDGVLAAHDLKSGKQIWKTQPKSPVTSSLALGNGLLYAGCADGRLRAFNLSNGKEIFAVSLGKKALWSAPVLFADKLAMGSGEGKFFLINAMSGTILHEDDSLAGAAIAAAPTVNGDSIIAVNRKGKMACWK